MHFCPGFSWDRVGFLLLTVYVCLCNSTVIWWEEKDIRSSTVQFVECCMRSSEGSVEAKHKDNVFAWCCALELV